VALGEHLELDQPRHEQVRRAADADRLAQTMTDFPRIRTGTTAGQSGKQE
jgi:hypothetical protein